MKQAFLLTAISATFIFYTAHAQSGLPRQVAGDPSSSLAIFPSPLATQTLMPTSFATCPPQYYSSYDWTTPLDSGWYFGTNIDGETDCAQRYKNVSGTVSQVLIKYAVRRGTTGTTTAEIFSINPSTKAPQTLLGTSAVVLTGNIAPTGYTAYTFSTPVPVTNGFYAGLKLPTTAGDSVAVSETQFGCSQQDSLSWEKFPSGWAVFNQYGPSYTTDIAIIAVADLTAGVNEYSSMGLSLLGAYPSPASDLTTIRYRLDEPSAVSIVVFDLAGNIIHQSSEDLTFGNHELKISLKDLSAGNYYYTINTVKTRLTSNFSVVK